MNLGRERPDSAPLHLPCGNCLGCRTSLARGWALRCELELKQHASAVFTTLTYRDETLPPTLRPRHLQLWLKRFRKALGTTRPVRFFASGEYGETTLRPHYHAILYGADERDQTLIEETWGYGHTRTYNVTPAAVAYVAGYTATKIGDLRRAKEERVDLETGEVYTWQPPFRQMSRRPGIGAHAKKYTDSWRLHAIHNGARIPVPRFLHQAWALTATPQQVEDLMYEKHQLALGRDNSKERIRADEQIAIRRHQLRGEKRKY